MHPIEYDDDGRINYNPDFHFAHGKLWAEEELEYLCKFIDYDGARSMQYSLGKTEKTIRNKINDLRKNGKFWYYKNLNRHW
ncbi:DNA-entry nuclease [Oceanobacillus arenosus]|uniref:DNA-entry nuclease n=1 Tax=Oceanobacillus arenosus TaxID=1229153 RepID=A0A3D8PMX6_9BACI|nr:DNA-entry nuclease [Oceanobacillus arenosus]RDW17022.1 DNA-entry nuclease [Oceanobacillus arenosus]